MPTSDERPSGGGGGAARAPGAADPPIPADAALPVPRPASSPTRALALDYGARRIGVAATDGLGLMAHPLTTLDNDGPAAVARAVQAIAAERDTEVIIVGLPVNMDGTRGPAAKAARAFADGLAAATGLPVETVDERLTTRDAEDRLAQAGLRDWRDRKRKKDQAAAALILEAWLDQQRRAAARRARG